MTYRIVSFLIVLSLFSCEDDLQRTNPLDPNSPYYQPLSSQTIQVLTPNGGEEFEFGSTTTISWTSTKVDRVNIELIKNNNIYEILDADIENTNSYVWGISSNISILDTNYKVRISSANNSEVYDESNSVFTIMESPPVANITIISPTLNDNWFLGSSYNIEWNATNISGDVSILLYQNGSVVNTIESSLSYNSSPYSWNIDANSYSAGVNYTIQVVSDNNSIYDESNPFSITDIDFSFYDNFSNQNVKIFPNINSSTSGIYPSLMLFGCTYDVVSSGGISGATFRGSHVSHGNNLNTPAFDIENIIPSFSGVTGTSTVPLILEMDIRCVLEFGGNYDQYYQSTTYGGYGFDLYDADQNRSFMFYADSYERQLYFNIWDFNSGSHMLNPSLSIDFGSMASTTSIRVEYNGSNFKIFAPNGNLLTSNSIANIDFESISFLFGFNSSALDATTYFDNVSISGIGIPAKKGKKKNASFLRSNNRNIKIPYIKK